MEKVCIEWNINCGNDAKNDYRGDHEVRTDHYKLDNGMYQAVYVCEFCDYYKMTRENFLETLDKWVNKDLFEKRNRWVPKFEIK